MNNKTTLTIITLLIIIITSTITTADSETYTTLGISRDNTYQQDGNGQWTDRTPVTYTRNDNFTCAPLVSDVDNDGTNEIITCIGTQVVFFNFTQGTGLVAENTYDITSIREGGSSWLIRQTPGLLDHDNDGLINIILRNTTHFIDLEYNGTNVNLTQSTPTGTNTTGTSNIAYYPYGTWKCSPGNTWSTTADTCVIPMLYKVASTYYNVIAAYDLDNNTYSNVSIGTTSGLMNHGQPYNTHLADLDSDGYYEVVTTRHDVGNYDLWVYVTEVTNPMSTSNVYAQMQGSPYRYTDVITSNIDPAFSGAEITWFYTDGTNWYGRTITEGGVVAENDYCGALTCPEGTYASNPFVPDSTFYADYTSDVCTYIRNPSNNDPGANIDTVLCVSRYAGSGFEETEVSNTDNMTSFFAHHVSLYGGEGVLTSGFGVLGDEKQSTDFGENYLLLPVDVQKSGSLDVIGFNYSVQLIYYDDNYINSNYVFDTFTRTPNPLCIGYTYTFTLTVLDDEGDSGTCFAEEHYQNGTLTAYFGNQSITEANMGSGEYDINFNYYADVADSRMLYFYCKDQYHSTYEEKIYSALVINTSPCNSPTAVQITDDLSPVSEDDDSNALISGFNDFSSSFGINSILAKSIVSLIVILLLCGSTVIMLSSKGVQSGALIFIAALEAVTGLIIFYWFGWMSAVPLVIIGLVCAVVIVGYFFGKSNTVGG